jgi:hypothetical protein
MDTKRILYLEYRFVVTSHALLPLRTAAWRIRSERDVIPRGQTSARHDPAGRLSPDVEPTD